MVETKSEEKEANRKSEVKIEAVLEGESVLVSSQEDIDGLSSRGYGIPEDGKLTLAFYETLFLCGKGIVEVEDKRTGKKLDFRDLLELFKRIDDDAWAKYLIYRDLRSRGYVVREGFGSGIDFRVYERGVYGKGTAKYLVFGIQEGQPVTMESLEQALRYVQSLKKRLILSVINRRGEVVYYSLSQLNLK